ncbi:MAG: lipid-A-disaccharide synthase [Proteobacteria bacterium]|nr:lipid-A-disaccharide synthase [Pseudomonadota bacterium]
MSDYGLGGDLLKIYIIAGEASGDLLGAHLMRSLKEQSTRPIQFWGVGGPRMEAEGLQSLFPYYELSRLGFVEILPYAFNLMARIIRTAEDIQSKDPHMLITIDCPGFCYRVARRLREENYTTLMLHYVAPTVWAYKPDRAEKCALIFDHLLTLLPFEPPYFTKVGLPATWVGHAAVVETHVGNGEAFRAKYEIANDVPVFLLMPGSRKGEVRRHMPIFAKTITMLAQQYPNLAIVTAVPQNMMPYVAPYFKNCPFRAVVLPGDVDKKDAIAASNLAIVKSGTVALEVAMAHVPMIVTYRVHALSAWLLKRMVLVKYVSLINILRRKEVIPELLQEMCHPFILSNAAGVLMGDAARQEKQKTEQKLALDMLTPPGGERPSDIAARSALELLAKGVRKTPEAYASAKTAYLERVKQAKNKAKAAAKTPAKAPAKPAAKATGKNKA